MRAIVLAILFCLSSATHPVYNDQFHGASSLAHYNTCYRWACAAGWNQELERYQQSAVSIKKGNLDLRATKCNVTAHGIHYAYCSGMVTTAGKFSFLYGHVETRMRLPKGPGLWPAFWMLADNGQKTTELDVMEVLGNAPNILHSGVHWRTGGHNKHKGISYTGPDLSAAYHVYAVDWRADRITWSLDGKPYYTTTDVASIPHTPMYLIYNLAVGGFWPGAPNASTPFPSDLLVDWVRVTA